MKSIVKLVILFLIAAAIIVLAVWGYRSYSDTGEKTVFRTDRLEKTGLMRTISATGTVEPEELVNVGAQVQGMIAQFGKDTAGRSVDYGSVIRNGDVLALIDDSLYAAELKSAEAEQLQAKAAIQSAKANIQQSEAKCKLALQEWTRAQQLYPTNAIAKTTYDSARADYDAAVADLAVQKASLAQAEASLAAANAAQERAARNLGYCTIKSPVDGVIIDRRVSVGQTVVSSMSAPSLFLIAKDLRRMQIWVSVNEADVGMIKVGQPVIFTVDAFQGREFKGEVQKIRLNATMSQNVVTYVVEVGTDNSDGTLLPYLTANVKFILDKRENAFAVPNAALRFTPDASDLKPEYQTVLNEKPAKGERTVWTVENEVLKPLKVRTGLNTGTETEIIADTLSEGLVYVTGKETVKVIENAGANSSSPFLPTPPHRRNQKKK